MMKFIERSVENKKLVWFEKVNRYLILELPAFEVLSRLSKDQDPESVALWCSGYYDLPEKEARRFVAEVNVMVDSLTPNIEHGANKVVIPPEAVPTEFYSSKHYNLDGTLFTVQCETREIEHLIYPKFAHLVIDSNSRDYSSIQIFEYDQRLVLRVDGKVVGQWTWDESHYMNGRFNLEMLNIMHKMDETGWLAVLHASAISYGDSCIQFLGESGNGKSTLSAILLSNGFHLLADDFVPMEAKHGNIKSFPAAISIKKSAIDHLLPLYPGLAAAAEFYYPDLDKTVRYLAPETGSSENVAYYPCKALVFVKYKKQSGCQLKPMPKDLAFQQLVPDSWISPVPRNAEKFMDWFLAMPCYQLTYSNSEKMVTAVKNLFHYDL